MSALRDIAVGLTRAWVALYTRGLPPQLRDSRRAEIDSDLWEQGSAAALVEEPVGETAFQLFARLLLGVPADITWRVQAGASARSDRSIKMNEPLPMRALLLLGLAVAAFPIVIGSLVLVGLNGEMSSTERALFGPIQFLVGSAIVIGLLVSAKRPALGIALVAAGGIAISVIWYWVAVFTAPIGLGLVAIAYVRSRPARRDRGPRPA